MTNAMTTVVLCILVGLLSTLSCLKVMRDIWSSRFVKGVALAHMSMGLWITTIGSTFESLSVTNTAIWTLIVLGVLSGFSVFIRLMGLYQYSKALDKHIDRKIWTRVVGEAIPYLVLSLVEVITSWVITQQMVIPNGPDVKSKLLGLAATLAVVLVAVGYNVLVKTEGIPRLRGALGLYTPAERMVLQYNSIEVKSIAPKGDGNWQGIVTVEGADFRFSTDLVDSSQPGMDGLMIEFAGLRYVATHQAVEGAKDAVQANIRTRTNLE